MKTEGLPSDEALLQVPEIAGVYALCDLDYVPVLVATAIEGVRTRVQRHFAQGSLDIIHRYQIDLWEIAFVWTWTTAGKTVSQLHKLEAYLRYRYGSTGNLVNHSAPRLPLSLDFLVPEMESTQLHSDGELKVRRKLQRRLPQAANHFARLIRFATSTEHATELRQACDVHLSRLRGYYDKFRALTDE